MIKYVFAIALLVGTSEAALAKCLVNGVSTACTTKCLRPIFDGTTATGLSTQAQTCAADANTACPAATCASCDTDDCNVLPVLEDYICDTYVWSTNEFKNVTATQQTCKKQKGKHGSCKTPGDKAVEASGVLFTGISTCTGCSDATSKDKTCATVSSARAVGALLMPLIALFYTLF